jgi:hypothetical protein
MERTSSQIKADMEIIDARLVDVRIWPITEPGVLAVEDALAEAKQKLQAEWKAAVEREVLEGTGLEAPAAKAPPTAAPDHRAAPMRARPIKNKLFVPAHWRPLAKEYASRYPIFGNDDDFLKEIESVWSRHAGLWNSIVDTTKGHPVAVMREMFLATAFKALQDQIAAGEKRIALEKSVEELTAQLAAAGSAAKLASHVGATVANLELKVAQLETRILDIAAMEYCGTHVAGKEYRKGQFVTAKGSVWHANVTTKEPPGQSGAWVLAVKRGRDGKDNPLREQTI